MLVTAIVDYPRENVNEMASVRSDDPLPTPALEARPPKSRSRRATRWVSWFLAIYVLGAYLAIPFVWRQYESRHPALENAPRVTRTGSGIPGDPVNLAVIASEDDLKKAMIKAGWDAADPLTLRSCLRIASATVLRKAYEDAPVSNLFLFGEKQSLAFEQLVGGDPRKRHHVRFWRSPKLDILSRPVWFGDATFDKSVGLSRRTGQITHHIDGAIDEERDKVLADLERIGAVEQVRWLTGFQDPPEGKNGGGDRWHTDGRLPVIVLEMGLPSPPEREGTTSLDRLPLHGPAQRHELADRGLSK